MSDAYPSYIEELSIEIADFTPIGPACHIPLPDTIPKRNNGIINMQNNDNWCFGWCVQDLYIQLKYIQKKSS